MSEWISVKDRLPSQDGRYLVLYPNRWYGVWCDIANYTNSYDGDGAGYSIRKGARCFYEYEEYHGGFHEIDGVTHWMPLPEPPEVE